MDHKPIDIVPKLKTFLMIERHASNVYTRSLFELVQKEIFVGLWHCQIGSKSLVEGFEVCIIKESPYVYEMPKKKKKPQSKDKGKDKAEEDDTVDLFLKKDGLYKVLRNVGDGSVVCSYEPRLGAFIEKLKSLKKEVEADCPNPPLKNKTDNLEQLVKVSKPPAVDVNNPTVGSTKGRKMLCIKGGK
nr:protein FAR1-related sequence 5 [Tanacetum cinerariifolium]